MRLRSAVVSSANRLASVEPWTDTRLISPAGTSYDPLLPTGAASFSIDQHDKLGASPFSPETAIKGNAGTDLLSNELTGCYEHKGVAPTIIKVGTRLSALTDGVGPRQKSGITRIWACVTPGKQYGVWAEVESVTDIPNGPTRPSRAQASVAVSSTASTSQEQDPGYQAMLQAVPPSVRGFNLSEYVFRPMRLRFGYVVGGAETVVGDFYEAHGDYPGEWSLELAVNPIGLDFDQQIPEWHTFASVLFQRGFPDIPLLGFPDNEARREVAQYKFQIDRAAASSVEHPLRERKTIVEYLPPRSGDQHFPWGLSQIELRTAVVAGYSLCVPQLPAGPTGVTPVHIQNLSNIGTNQERYFAWAGHVNEDVPGRAWRGRHAIKDGPSWHAQSLVPIGSAAAQDGRRHELEFVFPADSRTLRNVAVQYTANLGANTATAQFGINIGFDDIAVAAAGHPFRLRPSINGRNLGRDQYYSFEELPAYLVSQVSTNAVAGVYPNGVPYTYSLDFVINASARTFLVNGQLLPQTWTSTQPWPSLGAAISAGVAEDEWWWLQTVQGRQTHYKREWVTSRIRFEFHAAVRVTVTQVGIIACDYKLYRMLHGFINIDLTPSQCLAISNGQTVSAQISQVACSSIGAAGGVAPPSVQVRLV